MERINIMGCTVYYNPKNISKDNAIEQYLRESEEAHKRGSKLRTFVADVPHRRENWYETLKKVRGTL